MLSECLCVVCGFDVPTSDNRRKLFSSYKKTTACNNLEIILGYDIGPELSHTPNNCIICKRCYKKKKLWQRKLTKSAQNISPRKKTYWSRRSIRVKFQCLINGCAKTQAQTTRKLDSRDRRQSAIAGLEVAANFFR